MKHLRKFTNYGKYSKFNSIDAISNLADRVDLWCCSTDY